MLAMPIPPTIPLRSAAWATVLALALPAVAAARDLTRAPVRPPAAWQQGTADAPPAAPAAVKRLEARRIDRPIAVDGRLDDIVWRSATFAADFTQREPQEGAPATQPTEVAIAFDDDALYVGARLHSTTPGTIRALVTRRDREGSSEQLVVSFDTYRDRRTAYTFAVNAAGVRIDYYHPADFEETRDYTYDPVWEARTAHDSTGWSAEFRIPFSQLRFNASAEQLWGVNITRLVPDRNESSYWILVRRNDTGWASRMGDLAGIHGVRPSRRLEVLPYVATDTRFNGTIDAGNPFEARRQSEFRGGGDLKLGLGPNATLDATFNPDFGQVEADPAEVNLTAFETFFPERRPFFTEGTGLLNGRGHFYSRRIGAPPPLAAGAPYADTPSNTTILGAAKLTGRLRSGLSLAGLTAVTDREEARTFDPDTDAFGRAEVAPRTFYGVGVVQQEFGRDASTVYAMMTAVERDLTPGSPASHVLAQRAYSGIVDGRLRWDGGRYDMSAYVGFSYLQGDSLAIRAQQASSRRYYQRPDARHVRLDAGRPTLTGFIAGINHSKLAGAPWLWDIDLYAESPGLELNDLGRLGSADDLGAGANLRYRQTKPGRYLHSYELGVGSYSEWNFGRDRQYTNLELFGSARLRNFWNVNFGAGFSPRAVSDNLTRGGPLMGTNANWWTWTGLSGRPGARTGWSANTSYSQSRAGDREFELEGSVSVRPGAQWELSLVPSYSGGVTARQYVAAFADGRDATFGRRYVFAAVRRDDIAARVRLNYAFTPNLTLETYAEPFAARGQFHGYGELPAPRRADLRLYGTDGTTISEADDDGTRTVTDGAATFTLPNRDFTVRSFRSNAVLRWEWRPGSTLFMVWQQDRFANDPTGNRLRANGLWDALSAEGTQFLALKVSYWVPLR
jgi:hypothetical protein